MKVAVILNPTAGQGRPGAALEHIESVLCSHGMECDILLTEAVGDGETLAKNAAKRDYKMIIAAGGDGTVNEVVNGLVGTDATLGILPVGSVNVLARELGIPLNIKGAVNTLVDGTVKDMDLGCANGRYFTIMAGFGFDAEIVAATLKPVKEIIGTSAYVLKFFEKLATYQATNVVLDMPDETYSTQAFMIIVANVATYSYALKIAPGALPNDGMLDICVFERPITDKIGFIHQVADVFMNRHLFHDEVKLFRTRRVSIKSDPEVMVQLDGDYFSSTPVEVVAVPKALRLVVPKIGAHQHSVSKRHGVEALQ